MKYHYSHRRFTYRMVGERRAAPSGGLGTSRPVLLPFQATSPIRGDPSFRDISQVGSLAGAAYLLNHNAGVLKASSE